MQERMTGAAGAARSWLSVLALALAAISPASAEWTGDQRARFVRDCVERCQSTPNLSDRGRASCPVTCGCIADAGEKIMTPADFDEAERAAAEGRTTAKRAAMSERALACYQPASGK